MHIVLVLAMSMRVINPFVSHMPMDCLFDWAATLVWSNGAIYVRGRSLIPMWVEQCSASTSLWGKQWRFGAPIAFSLSTGVSDVCSWVLDVLINVFFGLTKQLPVVRFLIAGLCWKVGDAGHPSPFLSNAKRALYLLSYIFVEETVNAIVERSFRLHIVLVLAMSMRVISPFASHMPKHCPFDWAATLVLSNGAICVEGRSLIHMSVEQCFLRPPSEVNSGDSGTSRFLSKHYCFRCLPSNIRRTYQCLFLVWQNRFP